MAGPGTKATFLPDSFTWAISFAISAMSRLLLFSAVRSLDMKSNTEYSRLRSCGFTRIPFRPTAIRSPVLTSLIFFVDAQPSSQTITESIFWFVTGNHSPLTLTKVSKFVVE